MFGFYDLKVLGSFDGKAYLTVLKSVAEKDGVVSENEKIFLETNSKVLEIDLASLPAEKDIDESIIASMSSLTKKIIIRDAIVMAYQDGDFSEEERIHILSFANKFGIDQSFVGLIDTWLKKYWEVISEGVDLVSK